MRALPQGGSWARPHAPEAAMLKAQISRIVPALLVTRQRAIRHQCVPNERAVTTTHEKSTEQSNVPQPSSSAQQPLGLEPADSASASQPLLQTTSSAASSSSEPTPSRGSPFQTPESRKELPRLIALALPLMLQNVVGYASSVINLAYVGGLGATELSAFVLGSSIYNVCGLSLALGLSTGMDTLAGSAFGAREYGKLGLILQRAVIVCWAACVPVALAWFNSDRLLMALGQQPEISRMAAQLLIWWVPCLFLSVLGECMKRFLQSQRQVKALALSGLAGVLMAPVWFHLCMTTWHMGLAGSALASTLIQMTTLTGLMGYTIWRSRALAGRPEQPWLGWKLKAAAAGWKEYLAYGIPAAIMICLEWWVYEAVVIMSGWLPDPAALASMGICVNLNAWAYMLPMGLAAAVNTSVANALGAGEGAQAARAFRTGLALALALQLGLATAVATLGQRLVPLLCQDPAVRQMTLSLLPVLALVIVIDGLNSVVSGTLRGAGRQRLGATVNGVCCAMAIPAAWAFAFWAGMGPQGFWFGVFVGAAAQLLVLLTILLRAKGGDGSVQKQGPELVAGAGAGAGTGTGTGAGGKKRVEEVPWWHWDWQIEARKLQGEAVAGFGH